MRMLLIIKLLTCLLVHSAISVSATESREATFKPKSEDSNHMDKAKIAGECISKDSHENCSKLDRPAYETSKKDLIKDDKVSIDQMLVSELPESKASRYIVQANVASLRQVLFLHRHGDRTPIQFPSEDKLAKEPFWAFNGYGQLTNRGKARLHLLGQIIRGRYDLFMKGSVNKNNRISRSSGSLRCIESAQVFLSSFLSLNSTRSPDAKELIWDKSDDVLSQIWQPASIQSVPTEIDGMLAEGAVCKALTDEYANVIEKSKLVQDLYKDYKLEADVIKIAYNFDVDAFYKWFWGSSQIEVERSYFPDKMDPRILAIYDRMQEAGNKALTAYQSTLTSKRLRSGLLINDMVQNMKLYTQDPANTKKFVHYSAHDLTLIVILGMLGEWERFGSRPDYASNIAIELHQDTVDKVWFVRVFYMPRVPAIPIELNLVKCTKSDAQGRCRLDEFESLMKQYMIPDWQSWMSECQNDLTKINPYTVGR